MLDGWRVEEVGRSRDGLPLRAFLPEREPPLAGLLIAALHGEEPETLLMARRLLERVTAADVRLGDRAVRQPRRRRGRHAPERGGGRRQPQLPGGELERRPVVHLPAGLPRSPLAEPHQPLVARRAPRVRAGDAGGHGAGRAAAGRPCSSTCTARWPASSPRHRPAGGGRGARRLRRAARRALDRQRDARRAARLVRRPGPRRDHLRGRARRRCPPCARVTCRGSRRSCARASGRRGSAPPRPP